MAQMNPSTERKSWTWRIDLWLPRGSKGRIDWEFGISRCKLSYIDWVNNKVLLYSTGNYFQYPVINPTGKEYTKDMYV